MKYWRLVVACACLLLVTVIVTLFLVASIAVLLAHDSASSANTANRQLDTSRAELVTRAAMQHALWRTQHNACLGDLSVPATTLGADSYTASVSGTATGKLVTLPADRDAWIRSNDASQNYGNDTSNRIRFKGGKADQMLTRFDLSSIPANANIYSATAWFHLTADRVHPEGPITLHEVTAAWSERSGVRHFRLDPGNRR